MDRHQILVVDDYAGARYLRSRILMDAGYEVLEAENGEDALRLARAVRPSLILLDVNLPDISGTEVCARLKRDPGTAHIPVIQITGAWLSEDARRRGMASGANAYLTEPVDDVTLLREVENLLESATEKPA
jgi:two-component system, NtrC family, sensor kinase